MESRHLLLGLLLLSAHCACARGFVLRKRSWRDQDSHLAEALRVIERQRRRLEEPRENLFVKAPAMWGEPEGDERELGGAEGTSFLRDLFSDPREQYGYGSQADMNDPYPGGGGGGGNIADFLADEDIAPGEDTQPPSPGKNMAAVDDSELQDIFADSDTQKRSADPDRDHQSGAEAKREYDPAEMLEEARDKKDASSVAQVGLSPAIVNQLLESVQRTAADRVIKEPTPIAPVSNDEVSNILGSDDSEDGEHDGQGYDHGDEGGDHDEEEEEGDDGDDEMDDDDNKESFPGVVDDDNGSETSVKKKRSGMMQDDAEDDDEDSKDVLTIVKAYLDLEDDENDNLANALNLATRSQTERTNKYIPEEVDYLKNAIRDEQNIKALKSMLRNAGEEEEEEDIEEIPFSENTLLDEGSDDLIRKRTYPEALDISPANLEEGGEGDHSKAAGDVTDDVSENDDVDDDAIQSDDDVATIQQAADDFLSSMSRDELQARISNAENKVDSYFSQRLKDFLYRTVMSDLENDGGEGSEEEEVEERPMLAGHELVEEPGDDWLDNQVMPMRQEQRGDLELNPFLRELYQQYRARQQRVNKRVYVPEIDSPGIFGPLAEEENDIASITEADICPAVQDYTDDCAFARGLGLRLDDEAADLCNRHQLCYSCGGAHGFSEDDCDRGFLAESDRLCAADTQCKDDAAGLYLLMLEHHRLASHQPEECAAQCVSDYVMGLAGVKNRK